MAKPTIKDFIQGEVFYDKEGQYFWARQHDGGLQMLGELRGWGHIQNMFIAGGRIDGEAAADFQDELGQFVADAINEKIRKAEVI